MAACHSQQYNEAFVLLMIFFGWSGAVLGGSLAAGAVSPGSWAPRLAVPYMTAATVMGYLIGVALPEALQRIAHPLITCALFGNLAAGAWGAATGAGYFPTLRAYITKVICLGVYIMYKPIYPDPNTTINPK